MTASTSLQAYFSTVLPSLNKRQREVYEVIKEHGPLTNEQIASLLNRRINQVTGRTNELEKLGRVVVAKRGPCPITGFCAKHWVIRDGTLGL